MNEPTPPPPGALPPALPPRADPLPGFRPPPPAPPARKRKVWPWALLFGLPAFCCLGLGFSASLAGGGGHIPKAAVLKVHLKGSLTERAPKDDLAELLGKTPVTVHDIVSSLEKAKSDKRIKAVLVQLDGASFGWGKADELRDALVDFKSSGKPVYAFAEALDEKEYSVVAVADHLYLPPDSFFEFNGFTADVLHYPGLLEKLGVQVQYFRYGKYKSISGESMGRFALTEPVKEMIRDELDQQWQLFTQAIAKARKKSPDEVKALADGFGLKAEWALKNQLIDATLYWDEVETALRKELSLKADEKVPMVSVARYRHLSYDDAGAPKRKHKVALITSQGLIVAGKGGVDPFSGDESQGAQPIIEALRSAVKDDDIKAVVLRVDSPGGAGLGCDLVRREVEKLREKKPVVVSMSDYAASGGYWVSMDASAIVAQPGTLTGSIGIWSVIPNLKGTYEKLGLNHEVFTQGAHADAVIGARPMNEDEAKRFDDELKASYDRFVELAAKGRGKTHEALEVVAQGRTWLGVQAKENGLVDQLGGFAVARSLAAQKAKLPADAAVELVPYEKKRSLLQEALALDEEGGEDAPELTSAALRAAWNASGVAGLVAPAPGSVAAARALLGGERFFTLPPLRVDVH
ncbi:MAG: signal peptide peptidase SppA [Myxococcaceae bacterium]|nr:signal peptide peptidase SppA [Myxococcaceae bacterium]